MTLRSVTVRVPATSANLGSGFDCLGLALELTADVTVTLSEDPAPPTTDPMLRLAVGAAQAVFVHTGRPRPAGLSARYAGEIPIARGLGVSAVLRAGGVLAANELLGRPLDPEQLLALGAELEGHPDNVTPALLGGLQVSLWDGGRVVHVGVPVPPELTAVLLVPDLDMPTGESRRLLPQELDRQDCIFNVGRAALLVAAMAAGRLDALATAVEDRLHQPARAQLFPAMPDIFAAARAAGAHAAYLSGGGSSICALCSGGEEAVAGAMLEAARRAGVDGRTIITRPSPRGAAVVAGA
ncbi:MAG TPA: homoserine kinase [Dehalococcoidia bacterium]